MINVLLLGSGGREHAIAWKLSQSKLLNKLYIAPGNAGTSSCGSNVNINVTNFIAIQDFCLSNEIKMVVVGPEDPLVAGIYDYFTETPSLQHIMVIGPSKLGAMLEGSKDFAKEFMMRHNIPTAAYKAFTKDTLQDGIEFLKTLTPPYVLKADGLAAGKGVLICSTLEEAADELTQMLANAKFGQASNKVVIEEFLSGIEMSSFVLTDGQSYCMLPNAKDYKRIGVGDTGLNTGGMGTISPVPFASDEFLQKVEERIIKPTVEGLKKENITYKGFIFFGLINVNGEPYTIEYNVRMGDPETQSVMPRIESDLLELFIATADNTLHQHTCKISKKSATTVVAVAGGYPGDYEKGDAIAGIETVASSFVFHAGTANMNNSVVTNGGRVLAVTSIADSIPEALALSFSNMKKISFRNMYFRSDIGNDLKKWF